MTEFDVLATGPLTVLCDLGRPGYATVGVSPSGAADRGAYRLGQRLLGQSYDAAALEVTLGGLSVRSSGLVWVALTGAETGATVDGRPVAAGAPFVLQPGQLLRLGRPRAGLRTYLSVRGGFGVPAVLGSRSTDLLSGLGPPPVRRGDRLPIGPVPAELAFAPVDFAVTAPARPEPTELATGPGPRLDWFADPTQLTRTRWTVSSDSNRVGVRLQGTALRRDPAHLGELPSEPLVRGAIQVPPSGQPVVFLADHPVTGGYPVIGVLTPEATDLIAQARPGDLVGFRFRA
ncbi:biotin-dependent carboxyltransferase family protein [Granulicoccus phenolivorans]|uniref:5-oxoprolinase subunit C family protein n=1 Tax=Granulicoccus phenolivorans TaxID=266854 RepID=UPI0004238956|nr:biotin-dependent carboxyltransferase family protein [Granulicoccus phenolivorans]